MCSPSRLFKFTDWISSRHQRDHILLRYLYALCAQDWEDGEFTGQTQYYIYPDGATALHGVWIDGTMITSKAVELAVVRGQCDVLGTGPNPLLPEYYVIRELADDVFKSDLSTSTCISSAPKLPDPYERRCVCRRRSSVTGGGQGLFARRLLPAGTTVAYYNGAGIDHACRLRVPATSR